MNIKYRITEHKNNNLFFNIEKGEFFDENDDEYLNYINYLNNNGEVMLITCNEIIEKEELPKIRKERDKLLKETDKYLLSDYPITLEQKNNYIIYRQYLRDIPNLYEYYDDVDFNLYKPNYN